MLVAKYANRRLNDVLEEAFGAVRVNSPRGRHRKAAPGQKRVPNGEFLL